MLLPSNIRVITAPGLHRAVPRLRQTFVDVGNADKLSLLADIVAGSGGAGSAVFGKERDRMTENGRHPLTLVFCNTVSSSRAAEHALTEAGVTCLSYHGDLNSNDRAGNLKTFRDAAKKVSDSGPDLSSLEDHYDDSPPSSSAPPPGYWCAPTSPPVGWTFPRLITSSCSTSP